MTDDRLSNAVGFIKTKQHAVTDALRPESQTIPRHLTVCLIGAGKGIGEHIPYAYARAGAQKIIIAARTEQDLVTVAKNIKVINPSIQVEYHECDVASAVSVAELAAFVKSKFGRLDVLVLNAGYPGPVTLKVHEGQPEWVQQAFDVNAMGTYHVAHYFIPILLESEGGAKTMFTVGSFASIIRRGPIANTGYCVSKMAQTRLLEMIAEQYDDQGLTAINVHPGAVWTPGAQGNVPDEFKEHMVDEIDLCGAVCVWLSARIADLRWLSGRLISATWDMQELLAKKDEVVAKDLLKLVLAIE